MTSYSECIFCKIASRKMPATLLYEDSQMVAIADINPVAPKHILLIPKEHIESLNDVNKEHLSLLGQIQLVAAELAREAGIAASGYRLVCNCGDDGGQTVPHLHYHLLSGRTMLWPPG